MLCAAVCALCVFNVAMNDIEFAHQSSTDAGVVILRLPNPAPTRGVMTLTFVIITLCASYGWRVRT